MSVTKTRTPLFFHINSPLPHFRRTHRLTDDHVRTVHIVFYSISNCVVPLQEVALRHSPPTFSVFCYPCPYCCLLPHNVISPFLCPLLSLSILLSVAPQCHLSFSLSSAIPVHTALCCPTMSSLLFSVLCYPCPYCCLLPHNVISPFLCPLLSLSILLSVAPQCHLSFSLSSAIPVHTAPCCPTLSSLLFSVLCYPCP